MESQGISRGEPRRQTYTVRRIKPSDFPAAAEILANDSSLGKTLHSGKEGYHSGPLDGFIQSIRSRYLSPGWVIYVAVAVPSKDDTTGLNEIIVGYAAWKRTGTSPAAQAWSDNNEWNLNGMNALLLFSCGWMARSRKRLRLRSPGIPFQLTRQFNPMLPVKQRG
ncbi:uncharacterized protein ARB_02209 [Trichophyton benhamiae CBS 112371]|uniref:N-acetyltransferase domain-containing protein n=1 Tax=Arthroderma benhamiae (strain ATCC MYA-4681 / CBS 112371) TaxID=663331 RepID=D4B180_ARTBC|nr:uncharacterized protein ARB_02209 [Trichophyton benhamiae CBS 112371]EFE31015.1 hypothetical protein ARB_02209 [Trichophyton benhamiae CBS 112371]